MTALGIALLPALAVSQQRNLRGTVVTASGSPVYQALVTVRNLELRALTARDGSFSIRNVPLGTYDLLVAKSGTAGTVIRFETNAGSPPVTDLGTIVLAGTEPIGTLTIRGVVIDEGNGHPIPAATVTVGEDQSTTTDGVGSFVIAIRGNERSQSISVLGHFRIGYLPLEGSVEIAPGESEVTLRLALQASPIALEEIVVEGEARLVPSYLKGFYERQRLANGTFFTQEEIEKLNPVRISDLLRRVPGLDVIELGASGLSQEPRYRFAAGFLECAEADLFVDGIRVPAESFGPLARPEQLAGIETYRGMATRAVRHRMRKTVRLAVEPS